MHKKYFGNQIVEMHYVGHFIDNKEVDLITPQVMRCICHNNSIVNLNPETQTRRGLIKYNTINGMIAIEKICKCRCHSIIFRKIEKVNNPLKE
jgi:hypothetical protein